MIDVAHDHRDWLVQPQRVLEHLVQPLLEGAPVVDAGETVGENAEELVVHFRQFLLPLGQILLKALDAEEHPDSCLELGKVDRLGDVVVGARFKACNQALGRVERGLHDDRNKWQVRIGLEPLDHLESVHVGHHHVEQHEIRTPALNCVQRLLTAHRSLYLVTPGFEAGAQHFHVVFVIVNNENLFWYLVILPVQWPLLRPRNR